MTEPQPAYEPRFCHRCGKALPNSMLCGCRLPVTDTERHKAAETLRDYRTRILAPAAAKADAERSARIREALDDFNPAREPGEEG